MRATSVRVRLLRWMVGLILVSQGITTLAVLGATERSIEARAYAALEGGGRDFHRLLAERERQLLSSVEILASDFGFKRAVATRDVPTIVSVLENHGDRIRSDVTLLLDLSGAVTAAFPSEVSVGANLSSLLQSAGGEASAAVSDFGGAPHQVVLVPVKAPLTVGWVCMGFALDDDLARELSELSGLEVSFVSGRQELTASTLSSVERESVARHVAGDAVLPASGRPALLAGSDWITLSIQLGAGRGAAGSILQTSHSTAMRPYRLLRAELLALFALSLGGALGGSMWMARSVSRPIGLLADAAGRISGGDYRTPIAVESQDELGVLADTFRRMQDAIGTREELIVHQASHDTLTELPNRSVLERVLGWSVGVVVRENETLVVVALDIDRFKDVNATLGQSVGDDALRGVADRLRDEMGDDGFVARIGGDEFLLAFREFDDRDTTKYLEHLITFLEAPLPISGVSVQIRIKAGFVRAPEGGREPDDLIRRAEMALALAKEEGVAVATYRPELEEGNQRRVTILRDLDRAIAEDALEMHFQPKIEMRSGRLAGVEALIRWTHPELGPMRPDEFIALAEQAGSIGPVTQWVLRHALSRASRWAQRGQPTKIGVNLSAIDLANPLLAQEIRSLLSQFAVPPGSLNVEVTESAVMADPEGGARILRELREAGVRVSLDDFGTGHASLAQLKSLPVDELKIDQAFVRNLREGTPDEVIVRSTVELAHALGLRVVAEGVEDRVAWQLLDRIGCDIAQGYGISRPLAEPAFLEWMDAHVKAGGFDAPEA